MLVDKYKKGWVGDGKNTKGLYDLYYHVAHCLPNKKTVITLHEGKKSINCIKIEGSNNIHLKLYGGGKCFLELRTLCDIQFWENGYDSKGLDIKGLFCIENLTDKGVTISSEVEEYKDAN